jgi:hypothetical protein
MNNNFGQLLNSNLMYSKYFYFPIGLFLALTFAITNDAYAQSFDLTSYLNQHKELLGDVWADPEKHEIQIIYTQIDRDEQQRPVFTNYFFGVDVDKYFYPASTIKMPLALLALEKINSLEIHGLSRKSVMIHTAAKEPQTPSVELDSVFLLPPSAETYVRKLFCVSDNESSNRLYEFLGQRYIQDKLIEKGAIHNRIIHRLAAGQFGPEDNKWMNPVGFKNNVNSEEWLYFQNEVYSAYKPVWMPMPEFKGSGYINANGDLVDEPFDFKRRNAFALTDLHNILKGILFPGFGVNFSISKADRDFVWWCMGSYPRENNLDGNDTRVKFFIFDKDDERIPEHIRIFNKVGWSYGYLTDISYIVDFEKGIEFMLSATVYVNENDIFNDDTYQYREKGLPFLKQLGSVMYEHEQQRIKRHQSDLTHLKWLFENANTVLSNH